MSNVNLPHKKSYLPSFDTVFSFIGGYLLVSVLLTLFSTPLLFVVHSVLSDNLYICVTLVLSIWVVLIPHNCWLYEEAKIQENIHTIEKENGIPLTSPVWLYLYYIVFGNLFKSNLYFYVRVLVMILLSSGSWYLCTKYGVNESSFLAGIAIMAYASAGFVALIASLSSVYEHKHNMLEEDGDIPSPVKPDDKPKKSHGGYFE